MSFAKILSNKIALKNAGVGIVGMGYVGNALAQVIAKARFSVLGIVRDTEKANLINNQKVKRIKATAEINSIANCDIILVCVQTPIFVDKTPDLSFIKKAIIQISQYLRKGQLIIIESSVPVGTTKNVILPILQKSGLIAGVDFFLGYSPERVDPGNKKFTLKDIPKVVSGYDKKSKDLVAKFYANVLRKVVPVSSLETAEMVKLLENTFRLVNISFINELAEYTKSLGVDISETISAASSKPFGFLAHYPGPGVGGDCIPVVPYYILDDAKKRGINLKLLEQAGIINDDRPRKVAQRTLEVLKKTKMKNKRKVLLVGVSYKPDVNDIRESPALRIWEILTRRGISVSYHDPFVPNINGFSSKNLSKEVVKQHDMAVIVTNHSNIKFNTLLSFKKPILDTRNVFKDGKNLNLFRI